MTAVQKSATEIAKVQGFAPPGVTVVRSKNVMKVQARAGESSPLLIAALVIALIWSALWGVSLFQPSGQESAEVFVCVVATLTGLYCACLCLWGMFGRERATIGNGNIFVGSPWLFGLQRKVCSIRDADSFVCESKDCGAKSQKNCCCTWSTTDYAVSMHCSGKHVPVFLHQSRETEHWLCNYLNSVLAEEKARV